MALSFKFGNGFSPQSAPFNCCSSIGPKTSDNPIYTDSLSSVVDYITAGMDTDAHGTGKAFVHVTDPRGVLVYKGTGVGNERRCLLRAHASVMVFPFGRFMCQQEFVLALMDGFVPDENISNILKVVSNVRTVTSIAHTDNGISSAAVTKREIDMGTDWQNPVTLRPYRSFTEVEQPENEFVLRMHADENNHLSMALFEAGGKAWEHEAVQNIKAYLKKELALQDVTILA